MSVPRVLVLLGWGVNCVFMCVCVVVVGGSRAQVVKLNALW